MKIVKKSTMKILSKIILIITFILISIFLSTTTVSAAVTLVSGETYFIRATYINYFLEPGTKTGNYYDMSQRAFKITSNTTQRFKLVALSGGYYRIESTSAPGLSLDVENGSTADSARILMNPNSSAYSQQWLISHYGNGSFDIINRNSGKSFMNSGAGSGVDGSRMVQWPTRSYVKYVFEKVSEWGTFNDHILYSGVGGQGWQTYWIANSASSYTSLINSAVLSWMNTGGSPHYVPTQVQFYNTASQSNGIVEIHYMTISGQGIPADIGAISFAYWGSTNINPQNNDWTWAKIILAANVLPGQTASNFNLLSTYNRQDTIAHELGHTFGLNDTNTYHPYRVMTQLSKGRVINTPFPDDLIGINHLYH